jgi:hypothetical protein
MKILKKSCLVILIIFAGFLTYALLSPTLKTEEAETLSEEFIKTLASDPDAAYAQSSEAFQNASSIDDVNKVVAIADFDKFKDYEVSGIHIQKMAYDSEKGGSINSSEVTGTFTYMDGSTITAVFTWVREDKTWKIYSFEFLGETYKAATNG